MNIVVARIIGNELPPRDVSGTKLRSLQRILSRSHRQTSFWILNHLHDSRYREQVIALLNSHEQRFREIHFDAACYCALASRTHRIRYAININSARNHAIEILRDQYDFVACLDQDCYFTPKLWMQTESSITQDQRQHPTRKYYGLMMKRIASADDVDPRALPNEEPQLIFRNDATVLFDPTICFGDGDKTHLLRRLGYGDAPHFTLAGDECRTAGIILHDSTGDEKTERSVAVRMRLREQSIDRLISRLDALYLER